jgi:hypothetical protein
VDTIKKNHAAGQKKQYGPRLVGEILHDYLENSNEPLAVAYRERTTESEKQGWHRNTELSVNLKTILRSDVRMKVGKSYPGVLRLDSGCVVEEYLSRDPHFTFIETLPWSTKRNPRVFRGRYISVTRRDDGSLRLNFKPMPKLGANLSVDNYAFEVYRELRQALIGLVEEE